MDTFSHCYSLYLANLLNQLEEKAPDEEYTGRRLHLLGIWFEVKSLLLNSKLEKLGIQLQSPYIFSNILSQLLNVLESGQEPKALEIREDFLNKMVEALKALLVCTTQWD